MSEQLGQQALLERPKPKSLIVPRGHGTWWGVDGSTRCVALGVAGPDSLVARSVPFAGLEGGQRLSAIYAETRGLAEEIAAGGQLPGIIGVEQPSGSGQQVNHELEFAVGVIIAAVYDGVVAACGMPPAMRLIVGSWWKARSCGNGSAKKTKKVAGKKRPVKLELEEYEVMRWARLNGYAGGSWDEADALGMAEAMRGEWDLVAR